MQGCPARIALQFSLMPGLNQKIMRVRRQFVQGGEVGYGRADIKEIRLKVGVDCVKPLIGRKKRVNLCGNWFNYARASLNRSRNGAETLSSPQ